MHSDKSIEILKEVLENYPNRKNQVIIHRMDQNSGLALVRKWGIQNATGDYVIHCDSDDWVDTDMYNAMYKKAIEEDADVVVCDYITTDGADFSQDVIHIGCSNTNREIFIDNMLFQRESWSIWNKMFKRTTYYNEGFRFPEGAMGEDMATTLQLVCDCDKISYLPKALYYYNIANSTSITHRRDPEILLLKFKQSIDNVDIVIDKFEKSDRSRKFARGISYLKYNEKQILFPLVKMKKFRNLWRNTYNEINSSVIFFNNVRWQDKVKFYMAFIGFVRQ